MSRVLMEVCVDRLEDAVAAEAAGADRIELCGALELGGLTPSIGLVEAVLDATSLDVVAMIRPRAGGFEYDDEELSVAWRDAERFLTAGIHGLVFGALHPDGEVNTEACRTLVQLAPGKKTVFHRAFDYVPDPAIALDELIGCGVSRVLTSGRQATALAGAAMIREFQDRVGSRIEILPGGGIQAENVAEIVQRTGCNQVHLSGSTVRSETSLGKNASLATRDGRLFEPHEYRCVSVEAVRGVRESLGA